MQEGKDTKSWARGIWRGEGGGKESAARSPQPAAPRKPEMQTDGTVALGGWWCGESSQWEHVWRGRGAAAHKGPLPVPRKQKNLQRIMTYLLAAAALLIKRTPGFRDRVGVAWRGGGARQGGLIQIKRSSLYGGPFTLREVGGQQQREYGGTG